MSIWTAVPFRTGCTRSVVARTFEGRLLRREFATRTRALARFNSTALSSAAGAEIRASRTFLGAWRPIHVWTWPLVMVTRTIGTLCFRSWATTRFKFTAIATIARPAASIATLWAEALVRTAFERRTRRTEITAIAVRAARLKCRAMTTFLRAGTTIGFRAGRTMLLVAITTRAVKLRGLCS